MLSNNIIYAAGVLFYSKSIDSTTYFLLGKQNDNKWTNFGGSSELNDKFDPEITAARECWEETLGSVYDFPELKNKIKFKNSNYILSKTPSGYPYYLYIIKIPFNTSYRDKFQNTKKFISNIQIDSKFLEITDIKWVSLETLKYSIASKKPIIKLRPIFETNLKQNLECLPTFLE